jgi:hypothetical protein
MAIDWRGSSASPLTVKVAVAVTTVAVELSEAEVVYSAVMVVVPIPTSVAWPVVAPMVATAALLEVQPTALVKSCWSPVLGLEPIATKLTVGEVGGTAGIVTVCVPGMMASDVIACGVVAPVTVKLAAPVTTLLSALV